MKDLLEFREQSYFNADDNFYIKTNMGKYYVTKCHWYNGAWFCDEGLKMKMTSVASINCKELKENYERI